MIEITTNKKEVLPFFFRISKYNFIIYSIIDQTVPGRVFVDNLPSPEIILMWDSTPDSGIYIEGKPSKHNALKLNKIIKEEIIVEGKKRDSCVDFTAVIEPFEDWQPYLENGIFKDIYVRHDQRKFFVFHAKENKDFTIYNWRSQTIEPYIIIQYNHQNQNILIITDNKDGNYLKNTEFLSVNNFSEFKGFSKLINTLEYAKKPLAWCLLDPTSKTIITRVFSDWNSEIFIEFGIFTCEEHRKQGFGAITTAVAIEYAINIGYKHIGWHCWDSNIGSEKTALKAGMRLAKHHPVIHAWYNSYDNLLIYLNYLIENHRLAETMSILTEINIQKRTNTTDYQTSYHRKEPYYQRWLSYLQLIVFSYNQSLSKAEIALKEYLHHSSIKLQEVIKSLKQILPNSSIWEDKEWNNLFNG